MPRRFSFLLLSATCLFPQTFTFEESVAPWRVSRGQGHVDVTHEAGNVKSGFGALAFVYPISRGGDKFTLDVPAGLAGVTNVRFWIKTSADMLVSVEVAERTPGGIYGAGFWSRKASGNT